MKLLFIGDVAGLTGLDTLADQLPKLRYEYKADFAIVNGENSAEGNGITPRSAEMILAAGADLITLGNHTFRHGSIFGELDRNERMIRPANIGENAAGRGWREIDCGAFSIAAINLIGTTFMKPADNPFTTADKILEQIESKIIIVDFHAEATSEKRAMGFYLSGRVSCVFGTHTHVQTADEQIINGTGYITDVGMTGAENSVLGVEKNLIVGTFTDYIPRKHVFASGDGMISGAAAEIDRKTGKCLTIERFCRKSPSKDRER